MFVTFSVLKLVTSSEARDEQPANILPIFVTFSVLRFSTPFTCVNFEKLLNHLKQVVGLALANEASNTT